MEDGAWRIWKISLQLFIQSFCQYDSCILWEISLQLFILSSSHDDSFILWKILYNKGLGCIWKICLLFTPPYTVKVFGVYTGYLYWVYSWIFIFFAIANPLYPSSTRVLSVVFLPVANLSPLQSESRRAALIKVNAAKGCLQAQQLRPIRYGLHALFGMTPSNLPPMFVWRMEVGG